MSFQADSLPWTLFQAGRNFLDHVHVTYAIYFTQMNCCCRQRIRIDQRYRIETGSRHFTPVSGWIKLATCPEQKRTRTFDLFFRNHVDARSEERRVGKE